MQASIGAFPVPVTLNRDFSLSPVDIGIFPAHTLPISPAITPEGRDEMNTDDLTIKQARELAALFCSTPVAAAAQKAASDERPVIVRSRDAGVQFGYLLGYEGSTVHLRDARQMWSWTAAEGGTLLDCATHGVKAGKFSTPASRITVIGACAIIDCTDKAAKTLEAQKWTA